MIKLNYNNKSSEFEVLNETKPAVLTSISGEASAKNKIIKGDNLPVMQALLKQYKMKGTIDLVYIDPPFSTNNVFRHNEKRTSTISSSNEDDIAYSDTLEGPEFLEFLRKRLILIRELMTDHSSIYVHIDYKIGHYVKIIMDEIFGKDNFRNDITRVKCNPKNFVRNGYGNIKDLILFYSKTDSVWNEPYQEMGDEDILRLFSKVDKDGRRYTTTPLHAPGETRNGKTGRPWKGLMPPQGRHWRYDPAVLDELDNEGLIEWSKTGNPRKIIYADDVKKKGKRIQDIWEFKDPPYPTYPTEKNLDLLKLIVNTSSKPGQTVLDCFCGSGSTLFAASELGRNWIGIDISDIAIKKTIERFGSSENLLFDSVQYEYLGQIPSQELSVRSEKGQS